MKTDWDRNYAIIISPDNIFESVARLNRTVREYIDYRRMLSGSSMVSILCGPSLICTTSFDCNVNDDECELQLRYKGSVAAFALIGYNVPVLATIDGVVKNQDGSMNYGCALIKLNDYYD